MLNENIMTNTITRTSLAIAAFLLIVVSAFYVAASATPHASAGFNATQEPGIIATSSNPTIGTTAAILFASSTCNARIITTVANPIMLTFSDYSGQTPTATFGHLQAASTTVVYDAGQYGCGLYKAISANGASAAITVSESR